MKKALLLFALLCGSTVAAQGVRGVVQTTTGQAIAGAQITVCAYSSGSYNSAGQYTGAFPCSPTSTIYYDPAQTQPITSLVSDGQGNYFFYAASGNYTITITAPPRIQSYGYSVNLASGGTGCTIGGGSGTFVIATSGVCNLAHMVDNGSTITASEPTVVPSLNKVVKVDQEAGATADVKLANCFAALPSGGTCDARGFGATSQSLAATVTVPQGITILFDPKTYFGPASAALNLFKMEPDAVVDGFTLDCTSQPTYSGNVFENDTAAAYADGNNTRIDNVTILCSGVATGTGLFLSSAASSTPVAWVSAHHWRQYGLLNQILATASGNGFVNDNHFVDMQMSGGTGTSVQLHLTPNGGQVDANQCNQCSFQSKSATDLGFLIDGTSGANDDASNNIYIGDCWDSTVKCVNFSGNSKAMNNQPIGFFNNGIDDTNGTNGLVSEANLSAVGGLYIGGFPTQTGPTQIAHNSSSTVSGVTGTNYCIAQAHVSFLQCLDNSGNMGLAGAIKSVGANFTGTVDASGATQILLPVHPGYTSSANGNIGYDSTNLNWHLFSNGVDNIAAVFPASTSITDGDCVKWHKVTNAITLADQGAGCGGAGGTPASPTTSIQFNNSGSFGGSANFTYGSSILNHFETGVFSNTAFNYSNQFFVPSTCNPQSIFHQAGSTYNLTDSFDACMEVPSAGVSNGFSVASAGWAKIDNSCTACSALGGPAVGVGVVGAAWAAANNANAYGGNFACYDSAAQTGNICNAAEFDSSIFSTSTSGALLTLAMQGTAQPTGDNYPLIRTVANPSGSLGTTGLEIQTGSLNTSSSTFGAGVYLEPQAAGASHGSYLLLFGANNSGGTLVQAGLQLTPTGQIQAGVPLEAPSLVLPGSGSGSATITVPATAGTPTLTLGSNSGTPAVTASAPLSITTATGNITCTTCLTAIPSGTFQTNGVNNTTSTSQNLITSTTNADGLTVTPSNPGTNQEKLEITGNYSGSLASATNLPCGAMPALTGGVTSSAGSCATTVPSGSIGATQLAAQYSKFECSPGLGDGLNAIPAGTYVQFNCVNKSGVTWSIAGISCWTDNAGTSTLNAANNAATGLLTGAVTCNNTKSGGGAAGTQSATTTLAANDAITFTFVADGTTKQTTWTVMLTQ